MYLVYFTHKLKKMKSRFPWNTPLLYHSWIFFELSWCWFQVSWPVFSLLQMWQCTLDEQFTLPFAILQIIPRHTSRLPKLICPPNDDSTCSVPLLKSVALVLQDHSLHNLTNDCYHAEVVHDSEFVDTRGLSSLQFHCHGRVRSHHNYHLMHLRSDFSKPSVPSHLLLLWYINKT